MPLLLIIVVALFTSPPAPLSASREGELRTERNYFVRAEGAFYAVLGPEAPAILRVLIGESRFVVVQPGTLETVLRQQHIQTLILPQDWADENDLKIAQVAGVGIVTLQRHTSVKAIESNIHLLAVLTGTQQSGEGWIRTIEEGLARIQRNTRADKVLRVLILTPEGYTQGQGTLITDLLRYANGINVAAEAGIPEARQLEDAQIRQFTPDVVLLIGWSPDAATALALNPVYKGIAAFDHNRIFRIVPLGKDPANLVEDADRLANLIHPLSF